MESLCFIDVVECFCQGPQRPVYSQIKNSSVCFQHAAFRRGLDVFELGLQGTKLRRDLNVMLLECFLGSEISLLGLFLPV